MVMTKSRAAQDRPKGNSALPSLEGAWSETEIKALADKMLADLRAGDGLAKTETQRHGLQLVTLAAQATSQRLRAEEWLKIAFERITKLESELAEFKSVPRLEYKGTWKQGEECLPGGFYTYQGGVWHCHRKTLSRPCDDHTAWQLAVKAGRDAPRAKGGDQ